LISVEDVVAKEVLLFALFVITIQLVHVFIEEFLKGIALVSRCPEKHFVSLVFWSEYALG
jgi:hypothetical protein